jgi:hypothetical protein
VKPAAATDSIASVPAAAVVRLPIGGDAVFVAMGEGRFDVRWVWVVPSEGGRVLLRSGVTSGVRIATSGMSVLVAAARDSLSRLSPR